MSRFTAFGSFPVCYRQFGSLDAAYEFFNPGNVPYYQPIECNYLNDAMSLFWRVKKFKVFITREISGFPMETPEFDLELVAGSAGPAPVTEENLVCLSGINFSGSTLITYPSPFFDVAYQANLAFYPSSLCLIDEFFYYLFSIEINITGFSGGGSHPSFLGTEYPNPSTPADPPEYGLGDFVCTIPESIYSIGVNINTPFLGTKNIDSSGDGGVITLTARIEPVEFWEYADANGIPLYNSVTGEQINPDIEP